jgi:ferredoxin-2, mitochondrial
MPAQGSRSQRRRREHDLPNVVFVTSEGTKVPASGISGTSLLEVAQGAGLPLEGTCEGQMACSTCHVIIAERWFDRLPEPSMNEDDLLDLAAGVTRNSRLACQIVLTEDMDGMEIHVPGEWNDMQIC